MSDGRGHFPGIAVIDFFLNLVLVFAFLFLLSQLLIKEEAAAKKQDHTQSDALYLITVVWAGESDDDVDTYVEDPLGHIVFYKQKQTGLMCLNRDDTGHQANMVTLPDGRQVQSAQNKEEVEIRGIVAGEYTINVHMYKKNSPETTPTLITLYQVTPTEDIKIHQKEVTLTETAQEETAFRFTLTTTGEAVDINELQKRFVQSARE